MTAEKLFDAVRIWPPADTDVFVPISSDDSFPVMRKHERRQKGDVAQDRFDLVLGLGLVFVFVFVFVFIFCLACSGVVRSSRRYYRMSFKKKKISAK
jgi:hypothetical protein